MKNSLFFPILRVAVSFLIAVPSIRAQQEGDFTYSIFDNAVTITKYTGIGGAVTIPDKIANLPVRIIGRTSFSGPGRKNLTGITLPSGLSRIEILAFGSTAITDLTLPPGVTAIGERAFGDCYGLASVTIPSRVVSIGPAPFVNCKGLKTISVDPANAGFVSVDGVLFDKAMTTLVQYPAGKKGSYAIPSGVTRIVNYALYGSNDLTEVAIPSTVTTLGNLAFSDCENLFEVVLPASIDSIGTNAFSSCGKLRIATFQGNAPANFGGETDGQRKSVFGGNSPDFTICYYKGATGFTTPEWNGHKCIEIEPPAPPDPSALFDWTAPDGRSIKAKFVKLSGESVLIEKEDRKQITIPFAKLSPASIAQARELGKASP